MSEPISLSEARKNFSTLARDAKTTEVTVHGKAVCYIVPKDQYVALKKAALQKEFDSIFDEFDELFKALKDK